MVQLNLTFISKSLLSYSKFMHSCEWCVERIKISSNNCNNHLSTEKFQDHNPWSFASKVVCVYNKLILQFFFWNEKKQSLNLLKELFKKMSIAKLLQKHFSSGFAVSKKEEERFQLSNYCCMSVKLFLAKDDKSIEFLFIGIIILILNWLEEFL